MSADDKVSLRAWVAVTGGLFGCFMAGMNVHVTSAALPEIEARWEPPSRRAVDLHRLSGRGNQYDPAYRLAGGGVLLAPGDAPRLAGVPAQFAEFARWRRTCRR
ncbi:hypothetical protein ACPA9J_14290 [Pseudomonas aeruginosa]